MGVFSRKAREHRVEVQDVREAEAQYFSAICNCGWIGDARDSSEEAFRDAYGHSTTVAEEMNRPVG